MSVLHASDSSVPLRPPHPVPDRNAVDENGYPLYLDESDGMPMESDWHVLQMGLLIQLIKTHRRGQKDFYCAGNMFIYFNADQARNKDFRGPDFFLVNDVPSLPLRRYWAVWRENFRYPNLIIELMSPTTQDEDLKTKFRIYEERFDTREYVAYDPDLDLIHAWRKVDGKFRLIDADANGRVFLEEAGLWLGRWRGVYSGAKMVWLRFFEPSGELVLLEAEAEKSRADMEKSRADAEKARADALAAEIARLKGQM